MDVPILTWRYLPWLGEVPTLAGVLLWLVRYLPWMGVPTLDRGTYSGQGVLILDRGYLPWMQGPPSRQLDCSCSPTHWTDTQAENITFPHPSDSSGNKYSAAVCD